MGILDDAIKEHLELKREHGASEEEVARQEREALGPARREAQPEAEAVDGADPEAAGEEVVGGAEPDALPGEPEASAPAAEPTVESIPADEAPPAEEEPAPADEELAPADDQPAPAPDQPTPAPDAEPSEEGEDVLEETPEFLQETPEHDRLWFEQKPPRDFDFDDE